MYWTLDGSAGYRTRKTGIPSFGVVYIYKRSLLCSFGKHGMSLVCYDMIMKDVWHGNLGSSDEYEIQRRSLPRVTFRS